MAQLLTVGLLGDADRNSTWEHYLRPHPSVEKVVLTKSIKAIGKVDACIILNDHEALQHALTLTKQGVHCFLVGRISTELPALVRLQHLSEEAGTTLQFANWSYFNPVSLWMIEKLPKPGIVHINRHVSSKSLDATVKLDHHWMEDLALVMRWMHSGVYRFECNSVALPHQTITRNTWIQFDNGATASMHHTLHAAADRHVRFASNDSCLLEADILKKSATATYFAQTGSPTVETHDFADELPVAQALNRFLKAILMKSRSEYGIHDVVRFVQTIAKSNATVSK